MMRREAVLRIERVEQPKIDLFEKVLHAGTMPMVSVLQLNKGPGKQVAQCPYISLGLSSSLLLAGRNQYGFVLNM
jgi:hypothetical protein